MSSNKKFIERQKKCFFDVDGPLCRRIHTGFSAGQHDALGPLCSLAETLASKGSSKTPEQGLIPELF